MSRFLPLAAGAAAMSCVGGSVAVSAEITDAPLFTIQALRYAVACLLLLGYAGLTRSRPVRPRGAEWLWLAGIAATGLVIFNLALVQGARHAEPAVLGVAVACVPVLLAAVGPLLEGRGPAPSVLAGAVVVTIGAGLVQGLGRTDGIGLVWAVVAFACEAAFTLLAVPVLGRHGPVGVSVHTTWLAAAMLAVLGVAHEGPGAALRLTGNDLAAGAYLAVAVTAVAFVLWYACVSRIGAGRAGLLTGIAPIAAAGAGVALGGPAPRALVWVGIAVVALGLAVGLRAGRAGAGRPVPGAIVGDSVPESAAGRPTAGLIAGNSVPESAADRPAAGPAADQSTAESAADRSVPGSFPADGSPVREAGTARPLPARTDADTPGRAGAGPSRAAPTSAAGAGRASAGAATVPGTPAPELTGTGGEIA